MKKPIKNIPPLPSVTRIEFTISYHLSRYWAQQVAKPEGRIEMEIAFEQFSRWQSELQRLRSVLEVA